MKFTASDTTTKEETTYLTPKKKEAPTSSDSNNNSSSSDDQTTKADKRCEVKSVVDPRSGTKISLKEAVEAGIIDHQSGMYVNPDTGKCQTIPKAMMAGLIEIEYVPSTNTRPAKSASFGLITIRTQVDNRQYTITGAVDAVTGDSVDIDEAKRRGILDESEGYYLNGQTGEKMILDEAVSGGFILTDHSDESCSKPVLNTRTFAVSGVMDQVLKRHVPFVDAIRKGLIDRDTGNYLDNATGEKVFATDAIRKGLFKAIAVEDPTALNVDSANTVVVDRIDRVTINMLQKTKRQSSQ